MNVKLIVRSAQVVFIVSFALSMLVDRRFSYVQLASLLVWLSFAIPYGRKELPDKDWVNLNTALSRYDAAIRRKPGSGFYHRERGRVHWARGELDLAIEDFTTAIKINPDDAKAHSGLGFVYSSLGRLEDALAACNRAIELKPKYANSYGSRGQVYFLMERYEAAQTDFREAERLKRGHRFAIVGQAICYQVMGYAAPARNTWGRLVRLDRRYRDPAWLQQRWHCADAFSDAARQIVAGL